MTKQNENDCPIAQIDFEEAKKLADLVSIVQDLGATMQTCSRLKKLLKEDSKDTILIDSLWSTALTRYARCFADGKRFGLSEDIFDGLQGEPKKVHELYINLRNKHVAHSVNPFEQIQVGLMLSPSSSDKKEILGVSTLAMRYITQSVDGVHQLGLLTKVLCERVCKIAKEYEEKVLDKGKQLPIDELYKKIQPRLTAPDPELSGKARI